MKFTKNKYLKFLVELLVIFIGITLSFWVENFRQSNEDKKTETKYYEGFLSDLQKDKASLVELKAFYELEKKSAFTILKYYQGVPLNVDSFYYAFMGVTFARHFTPNTNTFDEVISSSNMKLLSDQSIKSEILDLRTMYSQIKAQEDHMQHDLNEYLFNNATTTIDYAEVLELFDTDRNANDQLKKDIKKLLEITQFKNFCVIIAFNAGGLASNSYGPTITKCDSLIKRIETKLNE